MASTVTPLAIIESAIPVIRDESPCAFLIVASTPASSNAFFNAGGSALTHRADDSVSGRITPTLPTDASPPSPPLPPPSSLPHAVSAIDAPSSPATAKTGIRFTQTASYQSTQLLFGTT